MDKPAPNFEHTVDLARQVLSMAGANLHQNPSLQEEFLRSIRQLQVAAEGPAHYVIRKRHQPLEFMCILMAIESGVLQKIVDRNGSPIDALDLAEETGTDRLLIVRIMRLLTAINVCDEAGENTYVSNPIAEYLNAPGQRAGMQIVAEVLFPIGNKLLAQMRAGRLHQFPDRTKDDQKSPFEWTFSMSFWEYFRAHPESRATYDAYMAARRDGLRPNWFEIYPAAEELEMKPAQRDGAKAALIVDVGGNHGYELVKFQQQYPHVKGHYVLQDLPETISGIKAPLDSFEVMAYDFFTPQPVPGARAYLFKSVCHDFTDQQCRDFLGNTAKAMDETSSMLIDDWVLPDAQAPILGASEDIMMMMLLAGMERSLSQWRDLLSSIGLKIRKVWPSRGGRESIIEAKRVSV